MVHLWERSAPVEISKEFRNFRLNQIHLALLLTVDLSRLVLFVDASSGDDLLATLYQTEYLLAICRNPQNAQRKETRSSHARTSIARTRPQEGTSSSGASSSDGDAAYQPGGRADGTRNRSAAIRQKVRDRDYSRCLFTSDTVHEAGHIWPFAVNGSQGNRDGTRRALGKSAITMSLEIRSRLLELFTPENGELASSDKSWNMICLSPTLHTSWAKAHFGLRWIGTTDHSPDAAETDSERDFVEASVEWNWLPGSISESVQAHYVSPADAKTAEFRRRVDISTDHAINDIAQSLRQSLAQKPSHSCRGSMTRDYQGRLWEDSRQQIFRIDREDEKNMKDVVDAQWAMVKIAALSGAGETPNELHRHLPDIPPSAKIFGRGLIDPDDDPEGEKVGDSKTPEAPGGGQGRSGSSGDDPATVSTGSRQVRKISAIASISAMVKGEGRAPIPIRESRSSTNTSADVGPAAASRADPDSGPSAETMTSECLSPTLLPRCQAEERDHATPSLP
ncbi:hypothetical protein GMORB2_3410 [Geosmithia morbida]|uniref:HNH nuclease domain-containing protein n=1 Tax=Geosmithia morbida TaxID=1094350 RepID=A0A9P4YS46_9HYPO|nr:uncharacterized protein GMORB2_3410 [Geosmithia morbida]KAF4119999.1 hypothetical protein GMORB2_3410 [Geosmithia morbida]